MKMRRFHPRQMAMLLLAGMLLLSGCTDTAAPPADGEITIYRDSWGIPYVFAETESGAQFAHGYVQAEDHLEQMLINFLFANGRLSEFFQPGDPKLEEAGYADKDPAELDRLTRLFRFRDVAEKGWDQMDSLDFPAWDTSTSRLIEAFVDGINHYMEQNPEKVPDWWDGEVDPVSVVAWSRVLPLSYQLEWIFQKLPGSNAPSPDDSTNGSNGWVMGPSRTSSGNVMVQSDPHMPWSGPSIWYEVHLSGGPMELGGATIYGLPFPPFVHNRHTVTTLTSNSMNNGDVFKITVDPSDPARYLYGSESLPFTFEEHSLPQADGSTKTLRLAWSHHGPVLAPMGTHDFSSTTEVFVGAATMYEEFQILTELRALGRATDLESWYDALKILQLGKWNIMVGTVDGQIAYINNSLHPDRAEGANYDKPMDGSNPAVDWTTRAFWSFDKLATFTDPESGFLQNCNNSSGWSTPVFGDPINETAWPEHYMKQDRSTLRSALALRELNSRSDWDTESLLELSLGRHVLLAEWWVPILKELANTLGNKPGINDPVVLQSAITLLQEWDYQVSTDSTALTLFDEWRRMMTNVVDLKEPPPENITQNQGIFTLNKLAQAWENLETNFGSGEVPWGTTHRIRRGNNLDLPLSSGTSALGTLKVCNTKNKQGNTDYADAGSAYMRLVELRSGQAPRIHSSKPWGNSDLSGSKHFDDLTRLYTANGYKELWFERKDVEAAARYSFMIEYGHGSP